MTESSSEPRTRGMWVVLTILAIVAVVGGLILFSALDWGNA